MRAIISATFLASFLLMGCKDDPAAPADMTVAADLTAHSGTHCGELANCVKGCSTGDLGATSADTCRTTCKAAGSSTALTKYTALIGCGFAVCLTAGDAGAAKCSSANDTSMGCVTCVAFQSQGPSCTTQLAACIGD